MFGKGILLILSIFEYCLSLTLLVANLVLHIIAVILKEIFSLNYCLSKEKEICKPLVLMNLLYWDFWSFFVLKMFSNCGHTEKCWQLGWMLPLLSLVVIFFLTRYSYFLLAFCLIAEELHLFFFITSKELFLTLVFREKEKLKPTWIMKVMVLPWLVSVWQNNEHLVARDELSLSQA